MYRETYSIGGKNTGKGIKKHNDTEYYRSHWNLDDDAKYVYSCTSRLLLHSKLQSLQLLDGVITGAHSRGRGWDSRQV